MADQVVDRLFIEIGLKDDDVKNGISALSQMFQQAGEKIASFLGKGSADGARRFSSAANTAQQTADTVFKTNFPRSVDEGMSAVEARFLSGFRNIMRTFVGPISAALATGKLFGDYLSEGERLNYLSKQLKISAEDMQMFGNAFERAGGSAQGFQQTLKGVQANISNIMHLYKVGGSAPLAFLGIKGLRRSSGELKNALDLTKEIAAAAQKWGKTEQGRARFRHLASRAGFDEGTVNAMLNLNGEDLNKLLERQAKLGVMTEKDIKLAAQFKNALRDVLQVFKSAANIIVRVVLPPIQWLIDGITEFVAFLRQHERFVVMFFTAIAAVVTAKLIPAFAKLGAALLASPLTWYIAGITALVVVLEDLAAYLDGADALFTDLWSAMGAPDEIKQKWEDLKEIFASLAEPLRDLYSTIKDLFGDIMELFEPLRKAVADIFSSNASQDFSLWSAFSDTLRLIVDFLGDVVRGIDWVLEKVHELDTWLASLDITAILSGWSDAIKGWWDSLIGYLAGKWESFKKAVNPANWFGDDEEAAEDTEGGSSWYNPFSWFGSSEPEPKSIPASANRNTQPANSEIPKNPPAQQLRAAQPVFSEIPAVIPAVSEAVTAAAAVGSQQEEIAANVPAMAAVHGASNPASNPPQSTVTNTVTIGEVTIETQATDAQGIAGDFAGAAADEITSQWLVNMQNGGCE